MALVVLGRAPCRLAQVEVRPATDPQRLAPALGVSLFLVALATMGVGLTIARAVAWARPVTPVP